MFFSKKFDIHSIIHFLGCFALVPTFMVTLDMAVIPAAAITLILGMIWELLDELNRAFKWNVPFLDPRGTDILDAIVDFSGIFLAYLVF